MTVNKEICRRCCERAGWIPKAFDADWDNERMFYCTERRAWVRMEKAVKAFGRGKGAKKRFRENKNFIEECPYILEHIVNA